MNFGEAAAGFKSRMQKIAPSFSESGLDYLVGNSNLLVENADGSVSEFGQAQLERLERQAGQEEESKTIGDLVEERIEKSANQKKELSYYQQEAQNIIDKTSDPKRKIMLKARFEAYKNDIEKLADWVIKLTDSGRAPRRRKSDVRNGREATTNPNEYK